VRVPSARSAAARSRTVSSSGRRRDRRDSAVTRQPTGPLGARICRAGPGRAGAAAGRPALEIYQRKGPGVPAASRRLLLSPGASAPARARVPRAGADRKERQPALSGRLGRLCRPERVAAGGGSRSFRSAKPAVPVSRPFRSKSGFPVKVGLSGRLVCTVGLPHCPTAAPACSWTRPAAPARRPLSQQ
jgi:hypothetical protein